MAFKQVNIQIFKTGTSFAKLNISKYFSQWTLLIIYISDSSLTPFGDTGLRTSYIRVVMGGRSHIGYGSGVQIKIIMYCEFLDKWPSKRRRYRVHAYLMHIWTKASAPARRDAWASALCRRARLIRMLILTKRLHAADHCVAPWIRSPPHKGK